MLVGSLFLDLRMKQFFRYRSVILSGVFALITFTLLSGTLYAAGANIVVDNSAGTSIAAEVLQKVADSWPWYLTRASGLVAAGALILLMLSGIGFITGTSYRFLEPLTAWATHRALGIVLAIALALHMVALYFDHFVPFSVVDLLVPFASEYQIVTWGNLSLGSLYVALGVLAFYCIALIVAVSLLWVNNKDYKWKVVHLLSYLAMAFVFVHAIAIGTDLAAGALRFIFIGLGVLVLVAALVRAWRAFTL